MFIIFFILIVYNICLKSNFNKLKIIILFIWYGK